MITDEAVVWCPREFVQSPRNVLESASCHHVTHSRFGRLLWTYQGSLSWYADWTVWCLRVDVTPFWLLHLPPPAGSKQRLLGLLTLKMEAAGNMMSFRKRFESSAVPLWEPQISGSGSPFNSTVLCLLPDWMKCVCEVNTDDLQYFLP